MLVASHVRFALLLRVVIAFALCRMSTTGARGAPNKLPSVHSVRQDGDLSFRCCPVIVEPYVVKNIHHKPPYSGWAMDSFLKLQQEGGFQCKFQPLANETSYPALASDIESCNRQGRGCECDIGIGSFWQTPERKGIDFLPAHGSDGIVVVTHVNNTNHVNSSVFFITAFSVQIWLAIGGLALTFTLLKLLDARFAFVSAPFKPPGSDATFLRKAKFFLLKFNPLYRLRKAIQSVLGKMTGYSTMGDVGDDRSMRQWVLNFVIALCSLFLVLIYESAMTALLVQESLQSEYRSLADLETCRLRNDQLCFIAGHSTEVFWDNNLRDLPCRKDQKQPQRFVDYQDALRNTSSGQCQYLLIDGGTAGSAIRGRYCRQLVITGEPFLRRDVSFIIPRHWQYRQELRNASLRLTERGEMETLEDYLERGGNCEEEVQTHIPFAKLRIFFISAFAVCGVILCIMLVDRQKRIENAARGGSDSGRNSNSGERVVGNDENRDAQNENGGENGEDGNARRNRLENGADFEDSDGARREFEPNDVEKLGNSRGDGCSVLDDAATDVTTEDTDV